MTAITRLKSKVLSIRGGPVAPRLAEAGGGFPKLSLLLAAPSDGRIGNLQLGGDTTKPYKMKLGLSPHGGRGERRLGCSRVSFLAPLLDRGISSLEPLEGGASALDAGISATAALSAVSKSTTLVVGRSSRYSASRLVRDRLTCSIWELQGLSLGGGGCQKKGNVSSRSGLQALTILLEYHNP